MPAKNDSASPFAGSFSFTGQISYLKRRLGEEIFELCN